MVRWRSMKNYSPFQKVSLLRCCPRWLRSHDAKEKAESRACCMKFPSLPSLAPAAVQADAARLGERTHMHAEQKSLRSRSGVLGSSVKGSAMIVHAAIGQVLLGLQLFYDAFYGAAARLFHCKGLVRAECA